ncbi:MAG: hypothetical protein ABF917_03850, partial [Gluconobacter oxydans]
MSVFPLRPAKGHSALLRALLAGTVLLAAPGFVSSDAWAAHHHKKHGETAAKAADKHASAKKHHKADAANPASPTAKHKAAHHPALKHAAPAVAAGAAATAGAACFRA